MIMNGTDTLTHKAGLHICASGGLVSIKICRFATGLNTTISLILKKPKMRLQSVCKISAVKSNKNNYKPNIYKPI